MRQPIFRKAMKDMGPTLAKVMKSKSFITMFDKYQLREFYDTLQKYKPTTGETIDHKKAVLHIIEAKLQEVDGNLKNSAEKVAATSCVLQISIKQPGFKRKISSSTFLDKSGNNGNVDPDILHVSQDIIERSEIKKLKTHRSNFLNYIRSMEVPGGMLSFGNGQHLIPLAYVDQIKTRIEQFKEERQEYINEFEARYPTIIENSKKKRGVFFNPDDYPDFSVIRGKYNEEYRFISNNVPEELAKVSQRVYEEEKERIRVKCEAAALDIRDALRASWSGLVDHLVDSLGTDEETGKPKKFYGSGLTKLKEFIGEFQNKDLTDDNELQGLLSKANDLLENADPDKIRNDDSFRQSMTESFNKIKEEADSLVVVKSRKFEL